MLKKTQPNVNKHMYSSLGLQMGEKITESKVQEETV